MTNWNQCKRDPQHSGLRRNLTGPTRVETDWTVELAGPVGSPVLDRDTVFVGTDHGNVYAFERESGRRRWTVDTLTATDATPVVTRDRLLFATADGTVHSVDPATGAYEWETELPGALTSSLTHFGGHLFVGHEDGLCVLDAETGEIEWEYETEAPVVGCPAIADSPSEDREPRHEQDLNRDRNRNGTGNRNRDQETDPDQEWTYPCVYVGSENETVAGLEIETGEEIWTAPTDGHLTAGPTVADGLVYAGDDDGTLLALDADTGQPWFSYDIRGAFTTGATVLAEDDTAFIGADDGYLHVTDTTFGRRKLRGWLFAKKGVELDGRVLGSPVVVGDVCCVGDATGSLYGVDLLDDCALLWHTDVEDAVTSTPAVGHEQLFVGTEDGRLSCLTWSTDEPKP